MGYGAVADLAHRVENVLAAIRAGRAATPDLIQLLFQQRGRAGEGDRGSGGGQGRAGAGLLQALDDAGGRLASPAAAPARAVGRHRPNRRPARDPARAWSASPSAPRPPCAGRAPCWRSARAEALGPVTSVKPAGRAVRAGGLRRPVRLPAEHRRPRRPHRGRDPLRRRGGGGRVRRRRRHRGRRPGGRGSADPRGSPAARRDDEAGGRAGRRAESADGAGAERRLGAGRAWRGCCPGWSPTCRRKSWRSG